MGFVFIILLFIFWRKKWIDRLFYKCLGVVFLFVVLVVFFGWIMVVSGLINCFWVNVYKLIMYLFLVFIFYSYLLWIMYGVILFYLKVINN